MGDDLSSHQLAYSIAFTQLVNQKEDLRAIRNQASLAAAIAGLIATVFASMISSDAMMTTSSNYAYLGIGIEYWLVFGPFAGSVGFAIRVATGWKKCTFELRPTWVLEQIEENTSLQHLYEQLARDAEQYFDDNEVVISDAKNNLWLAMVLGWVQIPAWIILIV